MKENCKLNNSFFERHPLHVAKDLLGCILCIKDQNNTVLRGMIVETEAYRQDEPSCHAYNGVTKRSSTLFKRAGTLYVYFTYGMHYCANVVTEKEGIGSAVLIRALEPLFCNDIRICAGPAKLCKALGISTDLNETDCCSSNSLVWFEKYKKLSDCDIEQTVRIGIKKAQELPWRFYISSNPCVSKK